MWDQLKKVISGTAPTIATALGGPVAGIVVRELSKKLLGKDDSSEEELMHAVTSPHGREKLNQLEIELAKINRDNNQIQAGEMANARKNKDNTTRNVTYIIVVGFFGFLGILFFSGDPEKTKAAIETFQEVMPALITLVGGFLFGHWIGRNGNGKH